MQLKIFNIKLTIQFPKEILKNSNVSWEFRDIKEKGTESGKVFQGAIPNFVM